MEEFIQIIKDYGAAIISSVSVGGVAAIASIIYKAKKAIDETKEKMGAVIKQKEETSTELQSVVEQNKQLLAKIDTLTNDVYALESKVNVKGNRKG